MRNAPASAGVVGVCASTTGVGRVSLTCYSCLAKISLDEYATLRVLSVGRDSGVTAVACPRGVTAVADLAVRGDGVEGLSVRS